MFYGRLLVKERVEEATQNFLAMMVFKALLTQLFKMDLFEAATIEKRRLFREPVNMVLEDMARGRE